MECKDFEPSKIQENKILLLCKRLDKFDIDKIETISEIDQSELLPILDELIKENKLKLDAGVYSFIKNTQNQKKQKLPLFFQFHDKQTIDLIIRCFCSELPSYITCQITGLCENCIAKFYHYFRETLFNQQFKKLKENFSHDPQIVRTRNFFDQTIYFYTYENNIYVSETELKSRNKRNFTKDEIKEFKKVYCYISRIASHNKNQHYLHQKIAESVWRRNKNFENLYFELNNLLSIFYC